MEYNCLIVDDNSAARVMLRQLLSKFHDLKIVGECENAIDAVKIIKSETVDILFLDEQMPEMTGLELLRFLGEPPLTIIISSEPKYAIEAYELNVFDYIVKPYDFPRLALSINRAKKLLMKQPVVLEQNHTDNFIFIKEQKKIRKINFNELLWVEASGKHVCFYLEKDKLIIQDSLTSIEKRLPSRYFIRIHRKFIINYTKIDVVENGLVYINDNALPISDNFKNELFSLLSIIN